RGCTGKDLYTRIEQLETRGIDRDLVDDLHEARLLGNWTLHEGVEFSPAEVADVSLLIADAVEVLYVQPAAKAMMRDLRRNRRDLTQQSRGPE
ncbi:MAG: DUF4145 domain-containing protein, partial [Acidimicrobiales bacterium]